MFEVFEVVGSASLFASPVQVGLLVLYPRVSVSGEDVFLWF